METTTIEQKKSTRGRKQINVEFPQGEFNNKIIAQKHGISVVTAQNRINEALENKVINFVRKDKQPGKGRKFSLYQVA